MLALIMGAGVRIMITHRRLDLSHRITGTRGRRAGPQTHGGSHEPGGRYRGCGRGATR